MTLNYHLMHPGGDSLPGDPNAAFYLDGVCHLHYILEHPWKESKSFSFMHITSPDMLHWIWQPTKLQPSLTEHGMFSGTGFITRGELPAVIYHGDGSGRNQIAIAKDRQLSAWQKPYPVEVLNEDGSEATIDRHWDPDIFQIDDTYYAFSGGLEQPLFKSTDLRHWILVGDFMSHNLPDVTIGEDISCPNFFKLDDKWVLLCISHPFGCRYYIGDWDAQAKQFVPEHHGRMNWRRDDQPVYGFLKRTDFFAPESVLTPDGRRVMWAWLTSAGTNDMVQNKTIQSLPRELSIATDNSLLIKPLRELEEQRNNRVILTDITINNPVTGHMEMVPPTEAPYLQQLADLTGESLEIRIVVPRKEAVRKLFGFTLFSDSKDGGLSIMLRPETGTIRLGTTEAPFAVSGLPEGEDVELRIFIDAFLVEVFVNNRQALLSVQSDQGKENTLKAFCVGTTTAIKSIEIWKLRPTNQGFLEAQKNKNWEPELK